MDFCFNCGGKTDPDWVFCRACGGVLEEPAIDEVAEPASTSTGAPKVELISRGWDLVEVDTVEPPTDPLEADVSPGPLPPGAIEVTAGDVTVVEVAGDTEPAEAPAAPVDPWDHLRPHGEMPPRQHRVTIPARIGQVTVLLAAVAALAAAGIHFFLNTRLDAFADGSVSASAVDNVEMAADISLAVLAGLIVLAAATLGVWMLRTRATSEFHPGKAGLVALLSMVAGIGVVAASFVVRKETVTEAIAANSLIVLGLGLVMTACLATVRTVERIDRQEPA